VLGYNHVPHTKHTREVEVKVEKMEIWEARKSKEVVLQKEAVLKERGRVWEPRAAWLKVELQRRTITHPNPNPDANLKGGAPKKEYPPHEMGKMKNLFWDKLDYNRAVHIEPVVQSLISNL